MPKQKFVITEHPNTKAIYDAIELSKRIHNYRQEDLGKVLKLKQNTVSHHFKHRSFSDDQINELLDFFDLEIKVCAKG